MSRPLRGERHADTGAEVETFGIGPKRRASGKTAILAPLRVASATRSSSLSERARDIEADGRCLYDGGR